MPPVSLGPVYRVAIGAPRTDVIAAVSRSLQGATFYRATGLWQGNLEESTVVEWADATSELQARVRAIRWGRECNQEAVYFVVNNEAFILSCLP